MKRLILFATIVSFSACTKEEDPIRSYPIVLTREVSNIVSGSATFSGEILSVATGISDHGFIWTRQGFPTLTNTLAEKKSLGALLAPGIVEFITPSTLEPGKTYSMRAYVLAGQQIVYGKVFEFVSK